MYVAEGMHNFRILWDGGGQRNTLYLDAPPGDIETAKQEAIEHIEGMYWGTYRIVDIEERWRENGKPRTHKHFSIF